MKDQAVGGESTKRIVVVLGMHRSGTSATAGVLARLGITPPAQLMAAAPMNARGFYESEPVTAFNEDLMTHLGTTWFDLGVLPEGWAEALDQEWCDRGAAVLDAEFGEVDVGVLKDPRICRLLPFWLRVFAQSGRSPLFVCIHRPPLEVAGSLQKWWDFSLEFGEALWLRYALEAERASRHQNRAFISYSGLLSDWRGATSRLSATLGLELQSGGDAEAKVDEFLSSSLKHIEASGGAAPALPETAEVFQLLEQWSVQREDPADYPRFDAALAQLDASTAMMQPLAAFALDRFRQIERQNLAITEAEAKLAKAQRQAERLQQAIEAKIAEGNLQTERTARLAAETDQARAQYADLARQLAHVRRRPLVAWRDLWKYKLLKRLAAEASPLPARMKARMMRSAMKRSPTRSLPDWANRATTPAQARALAGVAELMPAGPSAGPRATQAGLPNLLVVTHDASWTGAPILALNLARAFSERYNVTLLSLRGGNLLPAFEEVATRVEVLPISGGLRPADRAWLKGFLNEGKFAFAVVNSIESRYVLDVMREAGLPTVALIHEFASYTLPRTAFPEAIEAADTVVFSTSVTMENAVEVTGVDNSPKIRILPQGKCEVPRRSGDAGPDWDERNRLKAVLKPKAAGREYLVIGAGTVQIRKGTDLFIEVARKTLARPEGRNYRFVWFGGGYAPDADTEYSVYLQDQLKRAGIEDRVIIQPVTPEIEYVYELADAFLLTSRLDPLPNVAIDAMMRGLPVIGFEKASGIPEILHQWGLSEDCVADYLDTSQMSDKLLALLGTNRERVSAETQAQARRTFDFAAYAAQIETWAKKTRRDLDLRPQAAAAIAGDPGFDPDYMRPLDDRGGTRAEEAQSYLDRFSRGIYPRRPEPGFNQNVYAGHHTPEAMAFGDAYADYLDKKRPEGPWRAGILRGPVPRGTARACSLRAALHVHAYYVDELTSIVARLQANVSRPTVFVSVGDAVSEAEALRQLSGYDGESEVRIVPNLGRDIGPLLTEFGPELIRDFDVVGHVHTKRSVGLQDATLVERWKTFTAENVLGGPIGGAMMDLQLAEFEKLPQLGLSFPADPYVTSWNKNRPQAQRLAGRLGLDDLPDAFDFPIGTMFWMRGEALAPFVDLGLGWADYPAEPLPYDGTLLHALERLFGIVPLQRGFVTRQTQVKGLTR